MDILKKKQAYTELYNILHAQSDMYTLLTSVFTLTETVMLRWIFMKLPCYLK